MKGDKAVEGGADKLDALADKAAAKGGVAGKLADELAEDASFLRKLKPSLIVARAKGRAPKDAENSSIVFAPVAVCRAIASTRAMEFLMRCFIS